LDDPRENSLKAPRTADCTADFYPDERSWKQIVENNELARLARSRAPEAGTLNANGPLVGTSLSCEQEHGDYPANE
jgi:hypothetical protein